MGKYKYEIIIYWSNEDNRYLAEVPELSGCISGDLTYEEALKNVEVIIDEWIVTAKKSGKAVPEPKCKKLVFA